MLFQKHLSPVNSVRFTAHIIAFSLGAASDLIGLWIVLGHPSCHHYAVWFDFPIPELSDYFLFLMKRSPEKEKRPFAIIIFSICHEEHGTELSLPSRNENAHMKQESTKWVLLFYFILLLTLNHQGDVSTLHSALDCHVKTWGSNTPNELSVLLLAIIYPQRKEREERDKTVCCEYHLKFFSKLIQLRVRLLWILIYFCCPDVAARDNFASAPWLLGKPGYTFYSGPFILKG